MILQYGYLAHHIVGPDTFQLNKVFSAINYCYLVDIIGYAHRGLCADPSCAGVSSDRIGQMSSNGYPCSFAFQGEQSDHYWNLISIKSLIGLLGASYFCFKLVYAAFICLKIVIWRFNVKNKYYKIIISMLIEYFIWCIFV